MVLNLNIVIKTRPKRIKHYASQIELDNDWREIKGFPHYRINRHGQENNANRSNIRYAIIHNGICKGYKWRYKDEKYNSIKPKIKLDICLPPINK